MSKFNNVQATREFQQAIAFFDRVYDPLKFEALTRFLHLVLDYLEKQNYDQCVIVEVVCLSYIFPTDPDASALNESIVGTLKRIISSYENAPDIEE